MTYWNFWKNVIQNHSARYQKPVTGQQRTGAIPPPLSLPGPPEYSISAVSQTATTSASSDKVLTRPSQCQKCGACCAFYRVSFPDNEKESLLHGCIPGDLTIAFADATRCMKGTETRNPRCIALHGHVGTKVYCTIYHNRPACCRNFFQSWENGRGNTLCDRARAVFGMQPFSQF